MSPAEPHPTIDAPGRTPRLGPGATRRRYPRVLGLAAAGVVVVAVHAAPATVVPAGVRHAGWIGAAALAAALVKIAVLGRLSRPGRGSTCVLRAKAAGDGTAHEDASEPHGHDHRLHGVGRGAHVAAAVGRIRSVVGLPRGRRRSGPAHDTVERAEARVPTPKAARYAKQLCGHAARMTSRATWNPPEGLIEFPGGIGTCRVTAEPEHLVLIVEGADAAGLQRMTQIIGGDIERFGTRERLTVTWVPRPDR